MAEKILAYGVVLYKIDYKKIKILLCKSVESLNRWGCLKGVKTPNETPKECAKREFFEESSIRIKTSLFEEYFFQENEEKNIGIWVVNASKIDGLDKYFFKDKLLNNYLSWENSKVKFFDTNNLPLIKKKQKQIVENITDFLKSKNQRH